MRKARDLLTLPAKLITPFLLPLFAVLLDGYGDTLNLHAHYLDRKVGGVDPALCGVGTRGWVRANAVRPPLA